MATEMTQWIMALNHPLRRQILRTIKQEEAASATELCQRFEMPLSNVSYHVKVLVRLKVLVPAGTRKVRGAKERFYRVTRSDQEEWIKVALEGTRGSDSRSEILQKE